MPRKPRTLYDGSIYHIYQRGNNKAFIFNDNKHKQFFIKQLHENNKVFDFQLLAYVVMSNHYHLIIKAGKDSLSDVMFHINNVYCKYINRELG